MPTYTGRCSGCGEFEEIMRATEYLASGGLVCPFCKEKADTVIRNAPAFVGPRVSSALKVDQIGQTFSSVEEQKAYFNRRKDRRLVSASDSSFKAHRDQVRNQVDATARRQGFQDHEDRKKHQRKEIAHRKALALGDRKVQI